MTNYCGHSPNWKTRGGAPIATGPRPSNTGPRALPATCWGLPIIYSVRSTPWPSWIRTRLPDAAKSLLEGVAATERDLIASMGRHKVSPVSPMGEKFDANIHEAMFEAPGTGQPAGTIIEVIETGYMMDERLLRPAKVGIAKDE